MVGLETIADVLLIVNPDRGTAVCLMLTADKPADFTITDRPDTTFDRDKISTSIKAAIWSFDDFNPTS